MYKCCFKRIIDFCIAFVALSVLFLPLIIVSLWLRFANRGAGILFFQERPGKEGKIFRVIKFKTMTDERDTNGNLLPDAQRMTKVGRFVRSTSIDELPQLINVLKGNMALIGPRPLLPQYLPLYSKEQARRHCSFLLDLKIIFMTIKKVFVREGINSDTSATMEAFNGYN